MLTSESVRAMTMISSLELHQRTFSWVSLIAGMECGMERWNGQCDYQVYKFVYIMQ